VRRSPSAPRCSGSGRQRLRGAADPRQAGVPQGVPRLITAGGRRRDLSGARRVARAHGTTFTHHEPPLVLLAGEAVGAGVLLRLARDAPGGRMDPVLRRGVRGVRAPHRVFRQVFRGIGSGSSTARTRTRAARASPPVPDPVDELWDLPVAEARRRLGIPGRGLGRALPEILVSAPMADALRQEWQGFGVTR